MNSAVDTSKLTKYYCKECGILAELIVKETNSTFIEKNINTNEDVYEYGVLLRCPNDNNIDYRNSKHGYVNAHSVYLKNGGFVQSSYEWNDDDNAHIFYGLYTMPPAGGCFIATATYGTPLHPQIDILRNYRDTVLNNNFWGKLFVKIYYKISPPIADFIRPQNYLRSFFRIVIDRIIKIIGK